MPKDFEDYLAIDEASLDRELRRHPKLVWLYSEAEADAQHEATQLKAKLDLVEAQLTLEVYKTPGKFGLPDKPTVGQVSAAVTIDKRHQEALAAYNEAVRDQHHNRARVAALMDKRRALERLVELKTINYFGEPRPRGEGGAEVAKETARRQRERDDD